MTSSMGELGSTELTKLKLNNFMVQKRPMARQARDHTIKKLVRNIRKLRGNKTKDDKQKGRLTRKADKMGEEILFMKHIPPDEMMKFALLRKKSFTTVVKSPEARIEERALCRLAEHKSISTAVEQLRKEHSNFDEAVPILIKGLGVRHREKKLKRLLQLGKVEEYLEKERKNLQLLQELTDIDINPEILKPKPPSKSLPKKPSSRSRKRKREQELKKETGVELKRTKVDVGSEDESEDGIDRTDAMIDGSEDDVEDRIDMTDTNVNTLEGRKGCGKKKGEKKAHKNEQKRSANKETSDDSSDEMHSKIAGRKFDDNEDDAMGSDSDSDNADIKDNDSDRKSTSDSDSDSDQDNTLKQIGQSSESDSDASLDIVLGDIKKKAPKIVDKGIKKVNKVKPNAVQAIKKVNNVKPNAVQATVVVKQLDLSNNNDSINELAGKTDQLESSDEEDFFMKKKGKEQVVKRTKKKKSNFFIGGEASDVDDNDDSGHGDDSDAGNDDMRVDSSKYFRRNLYREKDENGGMGDRGRGQGERGRGGRGRGRGERNWSNDRGGGRWNEESGSGGSDSKFEKGIGRGEKFDGDSEGKTEDNSQPSWMGESNDKFGKGDSGRGGSWNEDRGNKFERGRGGKFDRDIGGTEEGLPRTWRKKKNEDSGRGDRRNKFGRGRGRGGKDDRDTGGRIEDDSQPSWSRGDSDSKLGGVTEEVGGGDGDNNLGSGRGGRWNGGSGRGSRGGRGRWERGGGSWNKSGGRGEDSEGGGQPWRGGRGRGWGRQEFGSRFGSGAQNANMIPLPQQESSTPTQSDSKPSSGSLLAPSYSSDSIHKPSYSSDSKHKPSYSSSGSKLHPSWMAKKQQQSASISPFQGKRMVFDD